MEKRRVKCKVEGKVRQEKLDFLSKNPAYTKRLAMYVGKRCQSSNIITVAKEFQLDWKTVKEMEKEYMKKKLEQAGESKPEIIGIDEFSVRKGHRYTVIVSDLLRKRPYLGRRRKP